MPKDGSERQKETQESSEAVGNQKKTDREQSAEVGVSKEPARPSRTKQAWKAPEEGWQKDPGALAWLL